MYFLFSSRRRHTRLQGDWSSDVCSSDLHSAPNAATSPFYKSPYAVNPNAYPGAPGIHNPVQQFDQFGTDYKGGGDYFFFNFAAFMPALPPGDRQVYYGSFTPDQWDKYLTVF